MDLAPVPITEKCDKSAVGSQAKVLLNDKGETTKCDKNKPTEVDEPKPRIVLTFRSEKPGLKSNMKIVSNEEKHEEVTHRRSIKVHGNDADIHEEETNGHTSSKQGQLVDESDEAASDTSNTTPKRSVRCRNKEYSENVLANAIARKEKSYNETAPSQRLSRRAIKPTAKILANKELRLGLETQNNARLGISSASDKSPEEGVQTRRSTQRRSLETPAVSEESPKLITPTECTPKKRKIQNIHLDEHKNEEEAVALSHESRRLKKIKKKHLSKLGLQAKELGDESTTDSTNTDAAVEHLNTQKKLLEEEADDDGQPPEEDDQLEKLEEDDEDYEEEFAELTDELQSDPDDPSDEDFNYAPRRSAQSGHVETRNTSRVETHVVQKDAGAPRRRSTRLRRPHCDTSSPYGSEHSDDEIAHDNDPPGGEEGAEAACPDAAPGIMGACLCETRTNVHAAPSELEEPVFCRAIETVDGARVGCSHGARRDQDGSCGALVRAGPRTPYFLACSLHHAILARHMCCPSCGLYCTQGTFYQCSKGHFFHLECGILPATGAGFPTAKCNKGPPGCPHCGVLLYRWWQPANRDCFKVKIEMKSSNKRILLTEQRVHCTPAYLGFSKLSHAQLEHEPVIPEDLLPSPPIDVKRLRDATRPLTTLGPARSAEHALRHAIDNFESAEQLIQKMMCVDINRSVEGCAGGGSMAHLAARRGNLTALYLLQYAGADLDLTDHALRTPLMVAITALLDKSSTPKKSPDKCMRPGQDKDAMEVDHKELDKVDHKDADNSKPASDENLVKVIRYLVAAGCDVNLPGPEGMTALHMAAAQGGELVCSVLLGSAAADVDPRDHGGWTPLVWAAENKHPGVVRVLLQGGADPQACDAEGNAVLHWCSLAGAAACLHLLLDVAPPHTVDVLNKHNDTPLHVAARQGHYPCVVILLARGARTDIENSAGELAVEVCLGESQNAISLRMQLSITVKDTTTTRYRVLTHDISCGREAYPIPCVNEVDDAPLPDDFTYVTAHLTPANIFIDRSIDTNQGCTCKGAACSMAGCACATLGVRPWFTRGRLAPSFPYHEPPMLFECNQTCGCDMKQCCNTVVTRLSARGATFARAQVFRCGGGARGWGLRAAAPVPRGSPVALYCGELLTVPEADSRSRDHYMFALDLKPGLVEQCVDRTQLCVDAAVYGSAARFINHSCRPNLAPVRVFTETRDLRLPTITLFATRDIQPLEEFTFDYGDKFWSVKSKWMCCECGAADCRYPTVSSPGNASPSS